MDPQMDTFELEKVQFIIPPPPLLRLQTELFYKLSTVNKPISL